MSLATFFKIRPNTRFGETATQWARRMWDTYGFDYDTERTDSVSILAWPEGACETELMAALDADSVPYTTFKADLKAMFPEAYEAQQSQLSGEQP